jgi:DNA-directed RNA polymerase specialized sigma24 family protein
VQVSVVERAQRGDPDAFEVLVRDVGGRLVGLAFRILRDPSAAEGAVQQTLATVRR